MSLFHSGTNSDCYRGTIYVVENGNVLGTVVGDGSSFLNSRSMIWSSDTFTFPILIILKYLMMRVLW